MSLDRSLKSANSLIRHRNVLTRGERLEQLADEDKWNESKSVYGLPKVAHRKMAIAKAEKEEAPADGAAAVAGAPGAAAPAAGAKPGAPAAGAAKPGAKGAAPAAPAAKAAAPAKKK